MIKKMRKQIYVAPRMEVLLYDLGNDLVNNTITFIDPGENGEDLSKKNFFVFSDFPEDEYTWGDLWAENEEE